MIADCEIHGKTEFTEPNANLRCYCKLCLTKPVSKCEFNFSDGVIKNLNVSQVKSKIVKLNKYQFINNENN